MEPKFNSTESHGNSKSAGRSIAVVGVLVLAGLLWAGVVPRLNQQKTLTQDSVDVNEAVHEVNVVTPHLATSDALVLPGSTRALEETQLYARTSGYLSKRYVDIGSHVKAGQVLAEIESPDVDQQALQALADQAKAIASVGQSQADVRNKEAGVQSSQADVARARAAVQQARAMLAGSQSKLMESKAATAASEAKVAQTRKALETTKSSLKQAEAQRELANASALRYRSLLAQGFVARQDADQAEATLKTTSAAVDSARSSIGAAEADVDAALQGVESSKAAVQAAQADIDSSRENVNASQAALSATISNVAAAKANVGSSQANVAASVAQVNSSKANTQRFSVLKSFSRVVAPFDGVITLRNADVGSLVAPGDANNTKLALFAIARVDTLRIQVSVPQTYFQAVRAGTKASIVVREIPGRKFEGSVFENAGAIDPATRTLLTEVRVLNTDRALIPGMYAQVQFATGGNSKAIRIPSNTFTSSAAGTQVLVVGADSKLHFVRIKIGRDFGTEVEVASGLTGEEKLVVNPSDDLKEGDQAKILPATPVKKTP